MSQSSVNSNEKKVAGGENLTASQVTSAGLALANKLFESRPLHIPNVAGEPYKTELVIERDPEVKTVKVNWWHQPDDDRDPHSHPWDFRATILRGGYKEIRYWIDENGKLQSEKFTYIAGEINNIKRDEFHLVTDIEAGTVSYMECNHANPGNAWGYLDINSGEKRDADPDPTFIAKLQHLNRVMIQDVSSRPKINLDGFPVFPPKKS